MEDWLNPFLRYLAIILLAAGFFMALNRRRFLPGPKKSYLRRRPIKHAGEVVMRGSGRYNIYEQIPNQNPPEEPPAP